MAQLDCILATGEYEQETARRERLVAAVESVRHSRRSEAVRIPVAADVFDSRLETLGPCVHLEPGRLAIEFAGPEDLLRKLFCLSQAVANDYTGFRRAADDSDLLRIKKRVSLRILRMANVDGVLTVAVRFHIHQNGDHFGMCGGIIGRGHAIHAFGDDVATLHDDRAKRTTPAGQNVLDG